MKLRYLTAFVGSLMGLVALAACSGGTDDISMGSDGGAGSGGGKPAGGSNTGTAGKDSQSGSTSGGSASSGGNEGGGDESGGNPQGGSATGGSATGGTASGGSSSGGMSGGGSSSGGGSAGGPTGTCDQDEDCTQCYYPSWPATAKDCYCVACETAPMSEAQCQANAAQYSKLCAGLPMACPVVKCIPPAPAVCSGNQCFTKVVL